MKLRFATFLKRTEIHRLLGIIIVGLVILYFKNNAIPYNEDEVFQVKKQSFSVDVKTIGELEAAQSMSISSLVRGENGKIIQVIQDGTNVEKGDSLVKMDPTPFEEKLEALNSKLQEQMAACVAMEKGLGWEISQSERDEKMAQFEVEAAELELNKIIHGDGPVEMARLKGAMQKALAKYEEFQSYSQDLQALQEQGFLSPTEVLHAQKQLTEEKEAYEAAKLQYDSHVNHVYPMQVKKAEASLKQAKMKQVESAKIRSHAIARATVELEQARRSFEGIKLQIRDAERELSLTDIKAPAPGMVVLREDYRNGQRRKPRIGDVIVRNQVILELPDLNSMTVKSKVREVDLCKVEIGKPATIEIDAYPALQFTGKIISIGILAVPDPGRPSDEKYFEIRILLDKSDSRVRPGMTSRVIIHADHVQNAMTVPIHAIFHDKKSPYCYVLTRRGYEKREISTGTSNHEWMEVKTGLKEGDLVCLTIPTENRS